MMPTGIDETTSAIALKQSVKIVVLSVIHTVRILIGTLVPHQHRKIT